MIRENIEYHLAQGVDYFIATDNRSTDATAAILKEYERKGVLRYLFEGDDDYSQSQWVTRMARMAFTSYDAEWVINNDADEFWWPFSGTLKSVLLDLPPEINIITAQRVNFVAVERPESSFIHSMVFREKNSLNPIGRPLLPKVAHRGYAGVTVAQGNHSVAGIDHPKSVDRMVEIFHFPTRSYQQIENKIVNGGAAYERNTKLPSRVGFAWRQLYREYQANGDLKHYYEKHFYDAERLEAQLNSGMLVRDDRLSLFFSRTQLDDSAR